MYSPLQSGWRYLKYFCTASNGRGHGIHSPFVFEFVTRVLNDDRHFYAYTTIGNLRKLLLSDTRQLTIEDRSLNPGVRKTRKVNDIASSALQPEKFGQLLFRIAQYYSPAAILELGTSLGIATSYLAAAAKNADIITMEEAGEVAGLAKENFNKLQLDNIRMVEGGFDGTLQQVLADMRRIDLVCIHSDQGYGAVLHYYRQLLPCLHEYSILVFDGIHQGREMEQAWEMIRRQPEITLSIDLFRMGLVFFRKENKVKQHFSIRF